MRNEKRLIIDIILLVAAFIFTVASSDAKAAILSGEAQWHEAYEQLSVVADIILPAGGKVDGYIKYSLRKQELPDMSGAWCFPGDIIATTKVQYLAINGDGGPGTMAIAAGPVSTIYDPSDQSLEWLVLFVKKGQDGSDDQIKVIFAIDGDVSTPGTAQYFCSNPTAASIDLAHSGNFTLRP